MKTLLFLAFLLASLLSHAQHPSYYKFAEEQFKGVDIYDVIQDNDLNYWFATGQGLVIHDGYSYEKVSCPEMKGLSVFGFVKDTEGTIYFYNLHQQIFRILDGEVELYYEIPEDLVYHELHLLIDHENHLLIQTIGLIRIAPNKSSIKIIDKLFPKESPLSFHLLPDGSTVSGSTNFKFVHQKDGKLTHYQPQNAEKKSEHQLSLAFSWITLNKRVYAIQRKDLEVYELNLKDFTLSYVTSLQSDLSDQLIRLNVLDDQLWLNGIANGISVFSSTFKPLYNQQIIYPSYYISDFFEDTEGNVLLSTFDQGILVIPNREVQGYELPNDEKIIHIESDGEESLFLSTELGNIYQFKNGEHVLLYSDPAKKSNEGMKYWKENNILAFYSSKSALFYSWDGRKLRYLSEEPGAFKNAHFSNDENGLIAFNFGVSSVKYDQNGKLIFEKLPQLKKRAYCVIRDQSNESIYAGLSNGLVRISQAGKLENIRFKKQAVYPNCLLHSDGRTYVGTRKHGILVYENDELTNQIPYADVIRKMLIHKNQLFILSNQGLDVSDTDGSNMKRLNNSSGLSFEYISEFHISNNSLYLTDSKSLQFISLKNLFAPQEQVPIHFQAIRVNNKATKNSRFENDQRKFQFSFGVSTLKYRNNLRYRYKLEGYEEDWQVVPYSNNDVTYSALSPGSYTFIVQSLNGSTKSEPLTYSFTIDAPFHQKWWFYLLIFVGSGLLMALFFFFRLRNIRKKNKARLEKQKTQTDLLEFELKALRSQMNPHFIFNSLNSIQDLILKEETDASYDYIVLFADLVRSTLSHSNKDFIEIEKEIEFIKVYLSLEQLRFKDDFEYNISSNEITDIKLPTLLIQPFIENALIHGLIHKEGLKRLSITFNFVEGQLTCSIRDNGIGRTKAKEIQKRQGSHESFALNAIEKRLSILNQQKDYKCGFIIHDLTEDGQATGTEVIVTLPYKQMY